jgi:hypothetical protein
MFMFGKNLQRFRKLEKYAQRGSIGSVQEGEECLP